MALALELALPPDFPAEVLDYLHAEVRAQSEALRLAKALGSALVSADRVAIESATEALASWELAHRASETRRSALAQTWQAVFVAEPFSAAALVRVLGESRDSEPLAWQIGEQAGALRGVLSDLGAQTTLNHLLIEQHAQVLQGTYLAIAQALVDGQSAQTYAPQGAAPASGAALLDTRG